MFGLMNRAPFVVGVTPKGESIVSVVELVMHCWPFTSANNKFTALAGQEPTLHLSATLRTLAATLMKLWPKRFDAAKAQTCARNPKLIANTVYSSRMGNRDEASGDGYRFRGRGCIQLTGHANYFHAGKALGVDFVMEPDLVATPKYAALTAGWFCDTHK